MPLRLRVLVSAPFLGNDYVKRRPVPLFSHRGVPRQPSSAGTTSLLINRTDVTSKFHAGGALNTLIGGLETARNSPMSIASRTVWDDIAPTPLLSPTLQYRAHAVDPLRESQSTRRRCSVYAIDSIAIDPHWDIDAGLRWDRFESRFSETFSDTAFERVDTFVSPRAAVIFNRMTIRVITSPSAHPITR